MPQTTVLLSTYNCAPYIKQAIESILEQSYKDYEILIIDDGSTDETYEIVAQFKNIRYYKNERNSGISYSLNKGIDLAHGKYIARMDADDIMLGNRLNEQIDFLENNMDYGMVGGWYQVINERGKITNVMRPFTDNKDLRLALIFRNQFAQPTVTARTDLMQKLKYDTSFVCAEDHDLWIRFSEISKIANLPSYYLSYRWHMNNTCNTKQRELKTAILGLLSRELDKIRVKHTERELMIHAAVCFGVGKFFFKDEQRKKQLLNWYNRVFASPILLERYDPKYLNHFKSSILSDYCNLTN